MVSLLPFRALSPKAEHINEVAAPPYDVMSRTEARIMIKDKPHSILRVTRPDAILGDEVQIDDQEAYDCARKELKRLIDEAVVGYDDTPGFYIYTQQMGEHRQTGIVGLASADDYWADRIKKHEYTLPRKEDDRMRQVLSLGAHLGPVFLTHPPHQGLRELITRYHRNQPDIHHIASDGISHEIWRINMTEDVQQVRLYFTDIDLLYIADGHHRAAAAARVSRSLGEDSKEAGHFLSVSFASDELLVLPYQRVVTSLGMNADDFLSKLNTDFEVKVCSAPNNRDPSTSVTFPPQAQTWGMYLNHQWYILTPKSHLKSEITSKPLTAQLDVSILQNYVLSAYLEVDDPRTCEHVSFVGGIRGFRELEERVDACKGVAFALYPTSVDELMNIADSGAVMFPKSTWFEPKLRTGILMNVFDQSQLS